MVGSLTAAPSKPLQEPLKGWVEAAGDRGAIYVSMGTTAVPGESARGLELCDGQA